MKDNNLTLLSKIDNSISNNLKFGLINLEKLIEETNFESIKHFNRRCPYCKEDLYAGNIRSKIQYDHFIPIAKGGQDFPWNILPVCSKCNGKKSDKMPNEFLDETKYKECKDYLDTVLLKYTNQHEDYLQIAAQVNYFIKQHSEGKINDNKLIENIYQVYGIETKKQTEQPIDESEDITSKDKHIHFFWDALKLIKYNKESLYIKDGNNQIIYVKLKECYPIYRDYCYQIGEKTILYLDLLNELTQNSYKPFIKSNQKGRKYSTIKAGFGSCYRFQYERSSNKNIIIIGDKEVEL